MKTITTILKSFCLLVATFALAEAGLAFREIAKVSRTASAAVTEAGGAAAVASRLAWLGVYSLNERTDCLW